MPAGLIIAGWLLGFTSLSFVLTLWSIQYARHARLVDQPGHRRSHDQPMLRGGGIAIVATMIAALLTALLLDWVNANLLLALTIPLLLVAVPGWKDDHQPLSIRIRLLGQFIAAVLATVILTGVPSSPADGLLTAFMVLGLMWLTNLYNFMDGSHGLAAGEGVFAGLAFSLAFYSVTDWPGFWASLSIMAACLGFLPLNFPRPRIFMGDVASGPLGLAFGVIGLYGVLNDSLHPAWPLLILSLFIVDASLTLLNRIFRRQQWYTAHTEHAYQRLILLGFGHTGTWVAFQLINILILLPLLVWMLITGLNPWYGLIIAVALEVLAWMVVYRRSLKRSQ